MDVIRAVQVNGNALGDACTIQREVDTLEMIGTQLCEIDSATVGVDRERIVRGTSTLRNFYIIDGTDCAVSDVEAYIAGSDFCRTVLGIALGVNGLAGIAVRISRVNIRRKRPGADIDGISVEFYIAILGIQGESPIGVAQVNAMHCAGCRVDRRQEYAASVCRVVNMIAIGEHDRVRTRCFDIPQADSGDGFRSFHIG